MSLPSAVFLRDELCKSLEKMGLKETALEMFNSATSDEHRVAICLYFMETCEVKPPEEINPPSVWTKSVGKAMDLRKEGNMKYSSKEYAEAILLYTRSIATAPMNSSEEDPERSGLSLAFANRSAALLCVGKYRECIRDVDYALHLGYPWEWKSKLYLRRGKCEKLLGSANAAKENYKMALTYLKFCSDEKIAKEINNCLKDVTDIATQLAGTTLDDSKEESRLPLLKNGSNTKILSASRCVEIAYLTSMGRHLIATQPIDPGDVLVIDKAHSSVLFEDYCYTHCYHCLKRSLVLIPCINCTKLFDNYGYHYSLMDKNTRQVALQCYYQFSCNCQACHEEWPVFSHQPSDTPMFFCRECKAALNSPSKCSSCGAKANWTEIESYLHHCNEEKESIIFKLWNGENVSEGEIAMLIKYLKMLDIKVKLPWQQYCRCQEALKHYFSKMGNYFSAV